MNENDNRNGAGNDTRLNSETTQESVRQTEGSPAYGDGWASQQTDGTTGGNTGGNSAPNPVREPYSGQPQGAGAQTQYRAGGSSGPTQVCGNDRVPQGDADRETKDGKKCRKNRCLIALIPIVCAIAGFLLGFFLTYNCLWQKPGTEENATETSGQKVETQIVYRNSNDVSDIVESTMDSIVSITSTVTYEQFNFFTGYRKYEAPSGGSGIIVGKDDENLYIVTNNHVIDGAEDITVQFGDGSDTEANVNGTSTDPDVAILTVRLADIDEQTQANIKIAKLHTENDLKIGNQVIAIGNALGYGQTVTVGYISALDRTIATENGDVGGLIQTDAAINPGNSGGALINMNGEVIGINVAKYADTEVEGIGYSIPISSVKDLIRVLSEEKVTEAERGYLGIQATTVDQTMASTYDMPQGVYVYKILNDGIKDSGLMEHDVITAVDNHAVTSAASLTDYLAYYKEGTQVTLTVERIVDGKFEELSVEVTLIGADKMDNLKK